MNHNIESSKMNNYNNNDVHMLKYNYKGKENEKEKVNALLHLIKTKCIEHFSIILYLTKNRLYHHTLCMRLVVFIKSTFLHSIIFLINFQIVSIYE